MRPVLILVSIFALIAVSADLGQTAAPPPARSIAADTAKVLSADALTQTQPAKTDSTSALAPLPSPVQPAAVKPGDSTKLSLARDSVHHATLLPDSLRRAGKHPDSLQRAEPQKIKLQKQRYGRHQVMLAVFMMIFVVGIVTMAQQWNPR